MRLAMVAPSVRFPDTLGQTTHQWALAKGLAERDIEVHLYCRRPKGLPDEEDGVQFHRVFSGEFPFKRPFFTASCRRILARDDRQRSYDLIHDRGYLFGGSGGKVGQAAGVPVVLQIDDNWPLSEAMASRLARFDFYQAAALRSCQKQLDRANAGFAVSATLKAQARDWHPDADRKLVVIPNGAHLDRFNPEAEPLGIRKRLGLDDRAPIALFVGAMGPWHGTDQLPEVARKLATLEPEGHVVVAGGGSEKWAVQPRTSERDAKATPAPRVDPPPPNLHWLGRLPVEEIPGLMVECQVGLTPYPDREFGFSPLKVFEYFACGLPVVASRLPSTKEVIDHERSGLLVPPGDGATMGEATVSLIEDGALAERLSRAGLEAARKTYNWKALVERLIELYDSVLAAGTPGTPGGDAG